MVSKVSYSLTITNLRMELFEALANTHTSCSSTIRQADGHDWIVMAAIMALKCFRISGCVNVKAIRR